MQTFKSLKDLGPVRDYLQRQVQHQLDMKYKQIDEDRAWAKKAAEDRVLAKRGRQQQKVA